MFKGGIRKSKPLVGSLGTGVSCLIIAICVAGTSIPAAQAQSRTYPTNFCFQCSGQQKFQWFDCQSQCQPIGLEVPLRTITERDYFHTSTDKCEYSWQPTQFQTLEQWVNKSLSYKCQPIKCDGTAWCSGGEFGWINGAPTGRPVYQKSFSSLLSETLNNCTAPSSNTDPTLFAARNIYDQLSIPNLQTENVPYGTEVIVQVEAINTLYTQSLQADVWDIAAGPSGGSYAATERGIFVTSYDPVANSFTTVRKHQGNSPAIAGTRHWAIASNPNNRQEIVFSNLIRPAGSTNNNITPKELNISTDGGNSFSALTSNSFRSYAINKIQFIGNDVFYATFAGLTMHPGLVSTSGNLVTPDQGLAGHNVTSALNLIRPGETQPSLFVGSTAPGTLLNGALVGATGLPLSFRSPGQSNFQPVNFDSQGRSLNVSDLEKIRLPNGHEILFVSFYSADCTPSSCRPSGGLLMSQDGGFTFTEVKLGGNPSQGSLRKRAVFSLETIKIPGTNQDFALLIGTKSDDSSSEDGQNPIQTRSYVLSVDFILSTPAAQLRAIPIRFVDLQNQPIDEGDLYGTPRAFSVSDVTVNGQPKNVLYVGTKR